MMTRLKSILVTAAIMVSLLAFGTEAAAQRSKETALRELMTLFKMEALATQIYRQMMPQMMPMFRMNLPGLPERAYKILEEEMLKAFEGGMAEIMSETIRIYEKRFTLAEIEFMTQFYRTPIGQKVIKELPALTREAMIYGQQWGSRMGGQGGRRWAERIKKEGLLLGYGLKILPPKVAQRIEGETRIVSIKGEIHNPTGRIIELPLLRGSIANTGGKEIYVWTVKSKELRVLAGEKISYETEVRNPPPDSVNINFTFTTEAEMARERAASENVRLKK